MTPEERDELRKKIQGMMDKNDYIPTNKIIGLILEERERCAKLIESLYPEVQADYYTFELGHVRGDGAARIRGS